MPRGRPKTKHLAEIGRKLFLGVPNVDEPQELPLPEEQPELVETVDLLGRMTRAAHRMSISGDFHKAHAMDVATLRLGELRNVLPDAIDAAPEELRSALAELLALI
ncbi:hypothetical protein [Rhizobium lusitanum]|uniref:hypothetical protein n=1 Tax=Rhizobium lusitanum TaxID=293958 RepID=UPI00195D0418|nr:hypothetical protein [Rhizobium lusitanum]MBM7045432.1 hypothetical protein [Rhizobium lusitanum]